jgi:F-type H+-transporting ATPase subunit gamma
VGGEVSHPLLAERELHNYGVVVLTSDRGLAGGLNTNILRMTERRLREMSRQTQSQRAFAVGRKGLSFLRYRNYDVPRNFLGFSDQPSYTDAQAVAEAVMESYAAGEVDRVDLAYTRFVTVGNQVPTVIQMLPLNVSEVLAAGSGPGAAGDSGPKSSYEFEPDPDEILGRLLPSYVTSRLYTAMLEQAASEHAARRRAMKAATDNAEELIRVYTRIANEARQAEITTEISEIVGGAEALSGKAVKNRPRE